MADLFGAPPPAEMSGFDEDFGDHDKNIEDVEELTPRNNPNLIGHEAIEKDLLERLDNNKMPHALILHGPKGIGKSTLAFRLTRYLFQQSENNNDLFAVETETKANTLHVNKDERSFRQVASSGHPDLLTVEIPEKKNAVDIEQIRRIAPFMRMTSNTPDGWRVAIVDDADTMTVQAQNALLKILEEPPKKAILILVTHRIGSLIPTIRSRCQSLSVASLPRDTCKKVIQSLDTDCTPQDEELFLDFSEGSPGTFINIVEEGGTECIDDFLNIFQTAPNFDPKMTHKFADSYGGYGKEKIFNTLSTYIKWLFRTLVKCKATNTKLPFFISDHKGLKQLYDKHSYIELLKTHDALDQLITTAKIKSLDKRNTLLQMFFLLQK